MPKEEVMQIRIQSDLKDALKEYSKLMDLPMSIVVREAIKEKIKFQK